VVTEGYWVRQEESEVSAGGDEIPMPDHDQRSGRSLQAVQVPVTGDLHRLRRFASTCEAVACLSRERLDEFVFAINEAATNALKYGGEPRWLRIWRSGPTLIAEVSSRGFISDPFVGRRRPSATVVRGRGLWLLRQLCDLVELRRTQSGTTVRMQVGCA
jgi:anti-sigma regulatory factor (Ser/Thr protein kinase)